MSPLQMFAVILISIALIVLFFLYSYAIDRANEQRSNMHKLDDRVHKHYCDGNARMRALLDYLGLEEKEGYFFKKKDNKKGR